MAKIHYACFGALGLALAVTSAGVDRRSDLPVASSPVALSGAVRSPRRVPGYGNLPIRFEPNIGQAPPRLQYLARGNGYTVAITEQGVVLSLSRAIAHSQAASASAAPPARLLVRLNGAGVKPRLRPERQQDSVSNYFVGNDPSKWHGNVANYAAVRYEQIYPGIDWVIYGNPQQLEYDFVVAPRADPQQIQLRVEGADALSVDDNGDLLVKVRGVTLRQLKPVVYQRAANGTRRSIDGHYVVAHHGVAFALGDYDPGRELIIDPALVYSSYFGGSDFNLAAAITADSEGNAYIAGSTFATDFPTVQPLQSSNLEGGNFVTAFISKFNAAGTALIYSTYLGGSGNNRTGTLGSCGPASSGNFGRGTIESGNGGDGATAIAVDATGNAYVAGFTSSSNFPTVGALQATNNAAANHGSNAFLAKLNAAGNALVYSTYLGGSGVPGAISTGDSASAIAVDGAGDAYLTGLTMSTDFPTLMPFQASNEEVSSIARPTAFVAKVNAAGSALVYSSYLGGSGGSDGTASTSAALVGDCANAIAVDGSGNAYVVGQTSSTNFPTVGAFQSVNRSNGPTSTSGGVVGTAFVTKINSAGSGLSYSSYLGGSTNDDALSVAVDGSGEVYVSGFTESTDFPTSNPLQPQNATGGHGATAFVTKFNAAGSDLIYSTYLGGSTADQANAIALDAAGSAYVAGYTYSEDFPVIDPLQATNNGAGNNSSNAFVSVLDPAGSTLKFSTYLGGSGTPCSQPCPPVYSDAATAIAVDGMGSIYVTGTTGSTDFPMMMAFQGTDRATNTFVTKIAMTTGGASSGTGGGGGGIGWGLLSVLGLAAARRYRRSASR